MATTKMQWEISENLKRPIKSWCQDIEAEAMTQARNLANHPAIFQHVSLMPDCHVGYGMAIGGVIACENSVLPNAVGVDIGCGMGAVETNFEAKHIKGKSGMTGAEFRSKIGSIRKEVKNLGH